MRGFQLWLNLPGRDKMAEPAYHDIPSAQIPRLRTEQNVEVVVIAGTFKEGENRQPGAVQRPYTEPYILDLRLPAGSSVRPELPTGHRALLYVYQGDAQVQQSHEVKAGRLVRLDDQGDLLIDSTEGAGVLLIAGKPLHEPIVQYGPFVMNSREEIEQALRDFRDGSFA